MNVLVFLLFWAKQWNRMLRWMFRCYWNSLFLKAISYTILLNYINTQDVMHWHQHLTRTEFCLPSGIDADGEEMIFFFTSFDIWLQKSWRIYFNTYTQKRKNICNEFYRSLSFLYRYSFRFFGLHICIGLGTFTRNNSSFYPHKRILRWNRKETRKVSCVCVCVYVRYLFVFVLSKNR